MRWIAALAIGVLCVANGRDAQARPRADTVLLDQRGSSFTLRALRGEPTVLTFVSTRCSDVCPIASAIFARLAQGNIAARLVTVTLDPQYDTPFVMSRYARSYNARAPQWRVASGQPREVRALLDAYGVTRVATNVHSTLVYLIDPRGRLVRTLPLSTVTVDQVRAWLAPGS